MKNEYYIVASTDFAHREQINDKVIEIAKEIKKSDKDAKIKSNLSVYTSTDETVRALTAGKKMAINIAYIIDKRPTIVVLDDLYDDKAWAIEMFVASHCNVDIIRESDLKFLADEAELEEKQ